MRVERTSTAEQEGTVGIFGAPPPPDVPTDPFLIESVQDWVGGLVIMRHPKFPLRTYKLHNVEFRNVRRRSRAPHTRR